MIGSTLRTNWWFICLIGFYSDGAKGFLSSSQTWPWKLAAIIYIAAKFLCACYVRLAIYVTGILCLAAAYGSLVVLVGSLEKVVRYMLGYRAVERGPFASALLGGGASGHESPLLPVTSTENEFMKEELPGNQDILI